ncbi:SUF system NifU family Fe-S cluster assembly protein [Candidatus Collierbacteria bacterium RIFOXYB1_FULL_49_13]|uniref:SUF system NifU family Fe-S cluster assembly protein n=1 Tax=Candidatus Collierbacteria bacterium RIFOXYB1_FULL_49_13 TaxID=1817728 RepID=A0A1F5FIX5_9BACT|nr:MAG: SUF system NifU family Fe-S cluster assembly protein [Candidatus Collierbacteria bacterium RIFOXYB1_FULL_49_13]
MAYQYRDELLDHWHHPQNKGKLESPSAKALVSNSSCGDEIELMVKVKEGVVTDVAFEGNGCALSTAAASMLTERIRGMRVEEVANLGEKEVIEMMGEVNPGRMKCVTLPLLAVKELVEKLS